MINYEPLSFSERDFIDYSILLNSIFTRNKVKSIEYLKWEYLANPVGKAFGINAISNGELIGHYAAQPIKAIINKKEVPGLFALHIATKPDYRGKGVAVELNNLTHELARKMGYEFVIGVANALSTRVYVNKLGFSLISPFTAKMGIGLPKIIKTKSQSINYHRIWNDETLQWRLSNPNNTYYLIEKKEGKYILAETSKKGLFCIMYFISMDDTLTMPKFIKPIKSHMLNIWFGFNNDISWQNRLFITFPERLKPSPLNLIFKEISSFSFGLTCKNILINPIDHDSF